MLAGSRTRGAVLYFWPENGANKVGNGHSERLEEVTPLKYVDPLHLELL